MTLEDVKPYCDKYGFIVEDIFGNIHISTKYERWQFAENDNPMAKVRLMHRNKLCDGWHEQFRRNISAENLILYIYEHETAKYKGDIICHFHKNGKEKR